MGKASLLSNCSTNKKYGTFSISENNKKLTFKLSSEEFSCQRVQSQTCLSYAECSRKSHVCKMYEIINKQVKFLTTQYIGTCKSAYTKGYTIN